MYKMEWMQEMKKPTVENRFPRKTLSSRWIWMPWISSNKCTLLTTTNIRNFMLFNSKMKQMFVSSSVDSDISCRCVYVYVCCERWRCSNDLHLTNSQNWKLINNPRNSQENGTQNSWKAHIVYVCARKKLAKYRCYICVRHAYHHNIVE